MLSKTKRSSSLGSHTRTKRLTTLGASTNSSLNAAFAQAGAPASMAEA